MSERVVELIRTLGSGDLETRLGEAARKAGIVPLPEEDALHLIRILTNSGLTKTPLGELLALSPFLDRPLRRGALASIREATGQLGPIHRVLAVPDRARILGDKCLFESGVARSPLEGIDIEELGRKAYGRAAELLAILAEDPELRACYEHNAVDRKSLDEDVALLEHWSDEFGAHAELLRVLLGSERGSILHGSSRPSTRAAADEEPKRPGAREIVAKREGLARLEPPDDSEPPLDPPADDTPNRIADLHLVTRSEEEQDEIRFRELVAAEKTVLFSALDTELLRDKLKKVVIYQEGAIDSLCDELALYSTGTQDPGKPASYFLIGPTGVGKNYLVESTLKLFESLWGIEVPYLELEGPEFTYPSDINELKGAARGFIRSDEEGVMTQFYKRAHDKPFSVILIDEVEKAHPQLRRFFLPIIDRGTMMDNRGKVLHFENTMIFYTSNIGYSDARQGTSPIGYGDEKDKERADRSFVDGRIRKSLSPEFINRVHLIHFQHLTREAVDEIFDLELTKIQRRYRSAQHLDVRVTPAARKELLDRGYSRDYGARNLAKVLNRWANIEVSKVLKRDEERQLSDVTPALQLIREMREGKRPFDNREVQAVVEDCARIRVPYRSIVIDLQGGEIVYDRG